MTVLNDHLPPFFSHPFGGAGGGGEVGGGFTLSWPLDNKVLKPLVFTQLFSENPDYYSKHYGLPGHNGIDFGGAIGDHIHAVADGTVIDLGFDPKGYGNYIVLVHKQPGDSEGPHPLAPSPVLAHREGGTNVYSYSSIYSHMNEPSPIPKNGKVFTGDLIGLMGWTGNVWPAGPAGTHLHFGLRDMLDLSSPYKGWLDPMPFFTSPPSSPPPASTYVTVGSYVALANGISCLNMRSAPSVTDSIIYAVMYPPHPPFKVDEIYSAGQDIWLRTGIYWVAFKYNGTVYMQVRGALDGIK
ncbi:MAG: M23 family metallopeptidase [Anaerolineales bacterium]|nr:M23 family metallopeptidase [Anaerolineales bacterium]